MLESSIRPARPSESAIHAARPISFVFGACARSFGRHEVTLRVAAGLSTAAHRLDTELAVLHPLSGNAVLAFEQGTWGASFAELEPDGSRACAVLFGELHNARELGALLDERELSEPQLALRAWQRWGAGAADRLLGDYALFAFDDQGRSFGAVSPGLTAWLFYRLDSSVVRFATHPLLLLGDESVAALDAEYFARSFFILTGNRTPFADIKFLRPGHLLEVDARSHREYRFFSPPESGTIRHRRAVDYRHELRSLLTEAVRCRLERLQHATISLSGGIDSGSIATCAADLIRSGRIGTRVTCLTFGDPAHPRGDESPFAQKIAQSLGLPHETVTTGAWTQAELLEMAVRQAVPSAHLFLADTHVATAKRTAALAEGGPGHILNGGAGEILMSDLSFLLDAFRERRVLEIARHVPLVARLGIRRSLWEVLLYARAGSDLNKPGPDHERQWLRTLPRFEAESRVHPSCRTIERLVFQAIGPAAAYGMAACRSRGAIAVSPYCDVRVQRFAYGIPATIRMSSRHELKILARDAFPEIPQEMSAKAGQVRLNEGMSARFIELRQADWIESALREFPRTLQQVIDVDLVCQQLPLLRDPVRSTRLFDLIAIAYWIEALRARGLTLE